MSSQPHTSDDSQTARTDRVLQGSRLCATCLHPMAGSPIERHLSSNILFARCNECGTPSPLLEYPSAAVWIGQLQSLAAVAVLALSLIALLLQMLLGWGSVAFLLLAAPKWMVEQLFAAYRASPGTTQAYPGSADLAWLNSEVGQLALSTECDVWNAGWMMFSLVCCAAFPAIVSGMIGGVMFLRGSFMRRMLLGNLATMAVCVGWYAFRSEVATPLLPAAGGIQPSWTEVVDMHVQLPLHVIAALTLWVGALSGTWLGPTLLRLLATTVLPPRERNLVAWIWTFSGKPVPRR